MFVIEDDWHAEWIGTYTSLEEAHAALGRIAMLPWDEAPNRCPCTSWRTCGRRYHVVAFDTSSEPWKRLSDDPLLEVSAKATVWLSDSGGVG